MAPAPRASRSRARVDGGARVPAGRSRRAARASRAVWTRSDSPRAARRSSSVAIAGHGEAQPVARTRRIGLARGGDQAGDMRLLLDGLAGVVAAGVARDLLGAGDTRTVVGAREQRQRAAHVRVRNRVAVAVEAHVRRLAGDAPCASRRSRRDARAAARAAAAPRRGPRRRSDRAARDAGADARSSSRQRRNCAFRSSTSTNVRAAKKAWRRYWIWRSTFPFSFAAAGRTRPRREVIVAGELEQPRMKANRGARRVRGRRCAGCRRPGSARRPETPRRPRHGRGENSRASDRAVKSAKMAREYDSTITKPESGRTPRPIRIEPKAPQSTWASSPASVVRRR